MSNLVFAYLGNFTAKTELGERFNTESGISDTLTAMGHKCIELQENVVSLPDILQATRGADVFLWTKTAQWLKCNGFEMLSRIKIPTVGIHLDRWFGLSREGEVATSPFFQCDYLFTADGDSDEKYKAAGVNHFWLNPGVLKSACYVAEPRPDLICDVGFVGSRSYHSEHYREKLIDWLASNYRGFRLFGANGDSWRGHALNQVFASTKVMVGDSCFAGQCKNYTSDRLYEHLGRGACFCYPEIKGITEEFTDGLQLRLYQAGNFQSLKRVIDDMLAMSNERRNAMRRAAVSNAILCHTWEQRMNQLIQTLSRKENLSGIEYGGN